MKKLFAILLVAAMMLSLAACGGGNANVGGGGGNDDTIPVEERYGGHLNVPLAKVTSLDPAKATGTWNYVWTRLIYEAPLTRDAEGNICPNVCNFELSEDRLTLKLWVREGVKFHDGTDVEIDDVIASVQRAVHKSPRTYVRDYIESVTKNDDGSATFKFKSYNEKTMYYIAFVNPMIGVMPKEICEKYTYESGLSIKDVKDAIGTGPYKVVALEPSVQLDLVRFEDYVPVPEGHTGSAAPKLAYMDSITVMAPAESNTVAMGLASGKIDLAEAVTEDLRAQVYAAGVTSFIKPFNTSITVNFNTVGSNNATANNVNLRKAIIAAIDIPELVTFVHPDGTYSLGGGPVIDPIYADEDFDKADFMGEDKKEIVEKYLQAANYNGEVIEMACGSNLTFATLIEAYLKEYDINIKIKALEQAAYNDYVANHDNPWDIKVGYVTLGNSPTLMSDALINADYQSAEKNALLAEMNTLFAGSDEYMAKWNELVDVIVEDCAVVVFAQSGLNWFKAPGLNFDYEGRDVCLWNAYWSNPEEHLK